MKFTVLTLFPEMIEGGLYHSILKRAADGGLIIIETVNIRDFAGNKHNRVDDYPYGGGCGMVMQAEPVYLAYLKAKEINPDAAFVYMTPQGRPFNQAFASELSREKGLILLCGHYEGIDERVIEEIGGMTDVYWLSLGDFVLTGGEIAAMAVIDCVSRFVPGVLSNGDSGLDESFSSGLLEYPQYTRPPVWNGRPVPEILLSGHHKNVAKWRYEQSVKRTAERRPDLL